MTWFFDLIFEELNFSIEIPVSQSNCYIFLRPLSKTSAKDNLKREPLHPADARRAMKKLPNGQNMLAPYCYTFFSCFGYYTLFFVKNIFFYVTGRNFGSFKNAF